MYPIDLDTDGYPMSDRLENQKTVWYHEFAKLFWCEEEVQFLRCRHTLGPVIFSLPASSELCLVVMNCEV